MFFGHISISDQKTCARDWLCECIIGELLPKHGYRKVFDPSCGSGRFTVTARVFEIAGDAQAPLTQEERRMIHEKTRPLKPMRCPECGARIEVRHTHYPSFACPGCKAEFCIAIGYLITVRILTAAIAFVAIDMLGLRGLRTNGSGADMLVQRAGRKRMRPEGSR